MSVAERPPIDLDSIEGINATYEYYRNLETDAELSRRIHSALAVPFHTRQVWQNPLHKDALAEHRKAGGRVLWLPGHFSNLNPFQEAAECLQEPSLESMIGNVSILTKPQWYGKPLIGPGIRRLYDTVPAIPVSRHEDQAKRDYANELSIGTMIFRILQKGEDGVLYPTKKRIKENHHLVPAPEKLARGPEQIAAALREEGVPLLFLISGRWGGAHRFTRATRGVFRSTMVHSLVVPPKNLDQTQEQIRDFLQINTTLARQIFQNTGHTLAE